MMKATAGHAVHALPAVLATIAALALFGAPPPLHAQTPDGAIIFDAARDGDIDTVRELLQADFQLAHRDSLPVAARPANPHPLQTSYPALRSSAPSMACTSRRVLGGRSSVRIGNGMTMPSSA